MERKKENQRCSLQDSPTSPRRQHPHLGSAHLPWGGFAAASSRGHLPGARRRRGSAAWGWDPRAASRRSPCCAAQSGLSNYFVLLVAAPGRGASKPRKGIYLSWDVRWHAFPQPVAEKLPALRWYPASPRRPRLFCKLACSLLLQLQRLRLHKVL